MDAELAKVLSYTGAFSSIAIAALGSAYGCGVACCAAVGAWKKCYAQNKPAPFQLVIFAGSPLSQTIYGMIVMFIIQSKVEAHAGLWPLFLAVGILVGLGQALVSIWQGIVGAAASDAFAESRKGFTNHIMAIGIVETVSIFVMAFAIVLLATAAK
jgi:V/A-type H+/Na+-transporting ATPase subunit K